MATPEETIAELASQVVALGGQVSNLAGQLSAKDDQIGRLLVLVEKLNGKLDAALKLLEQRDPARATKERESVKEALAGLPPRPEGAAEPPEPPPRPDPETTPRKRHAHGRTTEQPEHLTDTTTADRCQGAGCRILLRAAERIRPIEVATNPDLEVGTDPNLEADIDPDLEADAVVA